MSLEQLLADSVQNETSSTIQQLDKSTVTSANEIILLFQPNKFSDHKFINIIEYRQQVNYRYQTNHDKLNDGRKITELKLKAQSCMKSFFFLLRMNSCQEIYHLPIKLTTVVLVIKQIFQAESSRMMIRIPDKLIYKTFFSLNKGPKTIFASPT